MNHEHPILFSCPQMYPLVSRTVKVSDSGSVAWDSFPDGWPNLMISDAAIVRGRDVAFLASFDEPADIFRQLGVIFALPSYGARSLTVILPFFSTGTMDRAKHEGEIVTARTLARMLSAIPHCKGSGPAEIVIADIHALQERFYFTDNVVVRLVSAVPLLQSHFKGIGADPLAIAFPDEGARNRFLPQFAGYDLITCDKRKENGGTVVTIKDGNPQGRHVVIVDDLIISGTTAIECNNALRRAGARDTALFATHGVMPGDAAKRLATAGFGRIWITDSCPQTVKAVAGMSPFEVLSLNSLIRGLLSDITVQR